MLVEETVLQLYVKLLLYLRHSHHTAYGIATQGEEIILRREIVRLQCLRPDVSEYFHIIHHTMLFICCYYTFVIFPLFKAICHCPALDFGTRRALYISFPYSYGVFGGKAYLIG